MNGPLPSIRDRLSRLVLLLALLWALLATALVWLAVRAEVRELLDETLQDSADVLAEVLEAGALPPGDAPPRVVAASTPSDHFAWQLVDADGRVRLRSALAPAVPWHARPRAGLASVGDAWHSYGRPLGAAMLYVAQTGDERRETMAAVGLATAGTALAVGLLCLWLLRARIARELRPLTAFSAALHEHDPLAAEAAQAPLPAATRAELAPMHDAIEALGQRLARRLASERAFSAHAAHALRTPLAGIDAQLAVALREAPPSLQPRLMRTREAAARLGRVVAALLTLFRSGVDLQWQRVDVAALLARLPVEGLAVEVPAAASVDADPDLLAAALINLVDNALRHGATRLRVEVDGGSRVRLLDDGKGLPPERVTELRAALAAQRYEGAMGLGLMLADIVARAHGGGLELLAPASGFGIELRLGAAPALAGGAPVH